MGKLAPKVLITDDHELVREGLRRILLDCGAVRQVGEASNGAEALQALRREKWNLVILDLTLPDRNGLEVLKDIKASYPVLPVLILTILPEEQLAMRVLRAGADGFLSKGSAARDLVRAIETIMAGGKHVSAAVAARLVAGLQSAGPALPHEGLSEREDQVFRRIAAGKTVGEIARELGLSVKTISSYRTNTLRKLNVENNAQLMSYAYTHRLIGQA
jgi:two-component system, NarL family, invasion response regulator UvrY